MKVLVTGGAGYIASHTNVVLLENGHEVVCVDNLVNSSEESLRRVEEITGKKIKFYLGDVRDKSLLDRIFTEEQIDAVIHFAGLKAVGESCAKPILYYENNLMANLALCEVMAKHNVKKLVFSSSATVYGSPEKLPITEDMPLSTTNPYGATKLMGERMFEDIYKADKAWHIILLRYFNPVGAHPSGKIGEDPKGIPNNLMPYITQVAVGKLPCLSIFGNDFPTPDGTGVRDYIHVDDLAKAHLAALLKLDNYGLEAFNIGTGVGYSVLDMVIAFSLVAKREIPYKLVGRRAGDIAACFAGCDKAANELHWKAEKTLEDMCRDSWNWQQKNPNGYAK